MTVPDPIPHAVSWNLTQRCNLRCTHCYLDAAQRATAGPGELSRQECARVVDELAALNPQLLLILTGGEPLLHGDLAAIVERAASAGMTPVLGSNGTLIRSELARRLRDVGLRGWGVSIDSTHPAAHDAVRGVAGAWNRAIAGLRLLNTLEIPFVIQPSIFSWNRSEIGALARMALELGAEAINFYFLVCTGRGQGVTDISSEDYEEALGEISGLQKEFEGRLMVNAKCAPHQKRIAHQRDAGSAFVSGYSGGCPAATHYFRIGPQGEVSPCPYIPSQGASIRESSLGEIWACDSQIAVLRDRTSLGGRCGACEYRDLCGGCRARALAEVGDPLAEDPSCRYQPRGGAQRTFAPERTFGAEVSFTLAWTDEARGRLRAIPSFLTAMVVARVESRAQKMGYAEVTAGLMREVRASALGESRLAGRPGDPQP